MFHSLWLILFLVSIFAHANSAMAIDAVVVGPTISVHEATANNKPRNQRGSQQPIPEPAGLYPVVSQRLQPGRFKSFKINRPNIIQPLCLLGTDRFSYDWFRSYMELIKSSGAVCMLVSANSEADLNAYLKLQSGVPIYPASGDDVAEDFGVKYYPALISSGVVEQ